MEFTTAAETVITTEVAGITTAKEEKMAHAVPVYGLGTYKFDLIHITALVCLAISIMVSASVLCFLNYPCRQSLWSRPIGERLVVYLAICDLLFSTSHMLEHGYMLVVRGHPPDRACTTFAFFLNEFIMAQALIVGFTAFNAFSMVVRQRKIDLGCRDWKLGMIALGIPGTLGVIGVATKHLGPEGMWCYVDMRRSLSSLLVHIVAVTMTATFLLNIAAYGAIWVKIRRIGEATADGSQGALKYQRTVRIMMLFVAAYIGQWWAYVIYASCNLFGQSAPVTIRWGNVFFCNMGGVFNFIAYTLVRRKYQQSKKSPKSVDVNTLTKVSVIGSDVGQNSSDSLDAPPTASTSSG